MSHLVAAGRYSLLALLAAIFTTHAASGSPPSTDIETQRALFQTVFAAVERGDWSLVDDLDSQKLAQLEAYILWPDLRATWLRANIKTAANADIESFLQQYGALRPARELRYRHALQLAGHGDLAGYLRIYEPYYQGQNVPKLDCLALQAELAAGRYQRVNGRALDLWLVGKSQVEECDPVFQYLDKQRLLDALAHRKRYDLAIDNREFSLARWLGKRIDQRHVDAAIQWTRARDNPEDFLRGAKRSSDNEVLRAQLVYAAKRLTFRDPALARKRWARISRLFNFSSAQKLLTAQHIALWTARDNLSGAYEQLLELPPAAQSDEVLRWRARVSLRDEHWQNLLRDIDVMSPTERSNEEWRYWHAIAEIRDAQRSEREPRPTAPADLEALSKERSYYGFLAADELGVPYALSHDELLAQEDKIAALAARSEIVRARELFYVGQDGRGRSEWDAVTRYLSDEEKVQAAILADRWGWHSRAIATVASLGKYEDLALRYPLPFQASFEKSALRASIAPTWAYGIARSESLFMRDVRSRAGAIGLMQLMPATGRAVAKSIHLPYSGLATLTNPDANIRLGTTYLGQMAARYNGNQVLATAAYNAGPHRVDSWLPQNGTIDARIWIENIPFNETRTYVKRVFAAQAIFHWRMTGKVRRLTDEMLTVRALADPERLAAR